MPAMSTGDRLPSGGGPFFMRPIGANQFRQQCGIVGEESVTAPLDEPFHGLHPVVGALCPGKEDDTLPVQPFYEGRIKMFLVGIV